jgi:hypothetical protein
MEARHETNSSSLEQQREKTWDEEGNRGAQYYCSVTLWIEIKANQPDDGQSQGIDKQPARPFMTALKIAEALFEVDLVHRDLVAPIASGVQIGNENPIHRGAGGLFFLVSVTKNNYEW